MTKSGSKLIAKYKPLISGQMFKHEYKPRCAVSIINKTKVVEKRQKSPKTQNRRKYENTKIKCAAVHAHRILNRRLEEAQWFRSRRKTKCTVLGIGALFSPDNLAITKQTLSVSGVSYPLQKSKLNRFLGRRPLQ